MEVIEHHRAGHLHHAERAPDGLERLLSRPAVAWAVLAASLTFTLLAWSLSVRNARHEAEVRFERQSEEMLTRLTRRLSSYEAMLRGGASLYSANGGDVSEAAWRRYVAALDLPQYFPGVQGLGVSRLLAADVPAEVPPGAHTVESIIIYLEPVNARNLRAMGYDMLSEPVRREALLRARDTGDSAMTGIVKLRQEDGRNIQSGFLVYLPIYRSGVWPDSPTVRAERLWGWIYAPFRVGDLMAGVMGSDIQNLGFTLHDGKRASLANQFYASQPGLAPGAVAASGGLQGERHLTLGGHDWTVHFTSAELADDQVSLQPTLVAIGGLALELLLFGMVMMLARRKRLTEGEVRHRVDEVQARTAWLDAVSGLSPDGVLVFERDPQGQHRLVFTNPAFSQLFRLRPVDLLGLSESAVDEWLSGLGTEEAPMAPLGLRDVTVTLAGPPGRVLQRSAREDTRARVYYFSDVTRESEVERLKSEFLTTAAHELRTPLASVYGFAELLTLHDMPAEKRGRLIAIVYRQAGVLKHLVDELLDLARIDARGDRDLVRERHDMRVVAETACESVQVPGQASRITMELGAQALWVMADSAKLQQALVNALSNAMKYSDQGSPITLRTWSAQRQQVAWVGVRVTDKGMGMTPEQTARAFERFYRADPSGHILGAGLGLAIIKEMMTLHGGEVELHSLEGAGTEITLWLPMLHDMEAACTEGQAESALTS